LVAVLKSCSGVGRRAILSVKKFHFVAGLLTGN
jgi:hypothetical protein